MVVEQNSPRIVTGAELIDNPVPNIRYRILGLLRANGGRMSITGQNKMMKSFLTHDLSLKVAAGQDWLGYKTTRGNVLYVNLEISAEKFQERTQDIQRVCSYEAESLEGFRAVTIRDKNLSLDCATEQVQGLLNKCRRDGSEVHMLVLDPRARSIAGSENEEVVIKHFCDNVDALLKSYEGLSILIVTHMGKDPSKGAIGHSRFSGWLDTEIKLSRDSQGPNIKALEVIGRDTESATLHVRFDYPLHAIVEEEEFVRKSKVRDAIAFILSRLSKGPLPEQDMRSEARSNDITDYAFHTAIRELKDQGKLKTVKAGGQGNRKLLKLAQEDQEAG